MRRVQKWEVEMLNQRVSILIVDDEPAIRSLLEETLSPKYDCVSVESAGEALRLMDAQFFQLALVDIGLPGMSGLTLCMVIVNRYPRTPVITVSGNTDEKAIADALHAGASDYITKPFNLNDVLTTVERALKRRTPDAVA
jgi:two-component system KDP operon response regulator KdpE